MLLGQLGQTRRQRRLGLCTQRLHLGVHRRPAGFSSGNDTE